MLKNPNDCENLLKILKKHINEDSKYYHFLINVNNLIGKLKQEINKSQIDEIIGTISGIAAKLIKLIEQNKDTEFQVLTEEIKQLTAKKSNNIFSKLINAFTGKTEVKPSAYDMVSNILPSEIKVQIFSYLDGFVE